MLITEVTLQETIDNYLPGDEDKKRLIADRIYDMLQSAYSPSGGMKGSGFSSPEDMIENIPMWKVLRRGQDIKAVVLYKDRGGRKSVAGASDGTKSGKLELSKMMLDEFTRNRSYAEISGPTVPFLKKTLGDEFENILVPVQAAAKLFPNEEIKPLGKYEYEREINGQWLSKLMVGKPGKAITNRS